MNRHQRRVAVYVAGPHVALAVGRVRRELTATQARKVADGMSRAADQADEDRQALVEDLAARKFTPEATPTDDGLVRVSLGPYGQDLSTAQAVRLADRIIDAVEAHRDLIPEGPPAQEQEARP